MEKYELRTPDNGFGFIENVAINGVGKLGKLNQSNGIYTYSIKSLYMVI